MITKVINPAINSLVYLSILRSLICVEVCQLSLKSKPQDKSTNAFLTIGHHSIKINVLDNTAAKAWSC